MKSNFKKTTKCYLDWLEKTQLRYIFSKNMTFENISIWWITKLVDKDNILDNIVLKGINKIPKIILRQIKNNVSVASNKYKVEDIWVLDTVGSNLKDILCQPDIDITRTYSNSIKEVYRTLGIEAARQCIYNEIEERHKRIFKE